MARYDLNADVGEGFDDAAMLAVVSSANVACGFHAGEPETMRAVCRAAVRHEVAIGAQPSYRDREGFGRRPVEIEYAVLVADLVEQVETLRAAAAEVGGTVRYLKPHGALYHRVGDDPEQASAVVEVCRRYGLPLLALPHSEIVVQAARAGVRVAREFFADRAYDSRGRLVGRAEPESLVTDPEQVEARVRRLLADATVVAFDGGVVRAEADSICVHGDSPGAEALARAVRRAVEGSGADVAAFA